MVGVFKYECGHPGSHKTLKLAIYHEKNNVIKQIFLNGDTNSGQVIITGLRL